jgi:hypothetical protein
MAQNQVSTGFSMYNPRRLERLAFGSFAGASIDQFTDPTAQNPSNFLNLTNVLPTISGAFDRRWGLTLQEAASRTSNYNRLFSYAAALDTAFSGTTNMRLVLGTDGTNVDVLYPEVGTPAYGIAAFAHSGNVYGATSRDFFYVATDNGLDNAQKVDYSQVASNTNSRWGFPAPGGIVVNGIAYFDNSGQFTPGTYVFAGIAGTNYTSPTVSFSGGGGSGATATALVNPASFGAFRGIYQIQMTNRGSGYTSAPTVTITDSSGSGATFLAVVGTNSADTTTYQQVIACVMTGNIVLDSGRIYAIAFQNSVTGHVSDYIYSQFPAGYEISAPVNADVLADTAADPSQWLNQGCNSLCVPICIHENASFPDFQVDTVILMGSADGGDVEHLYEVAKIPISSFTNTGGPHNVLYYLYNDTLPDTFNDVYVGGPTLTDNNLWVDVDSNGNVIGINDNLPFPLGVTKPILHQGRMFATDGKSVYFSKSIDEVTTSTGLITSKWEEAWPGSNVLDLAYDDESLNGLLSNGQVLYIGTSDNLYFMTGNNSSNFSIPASLFRGVGVQAQDAWSVVYKDNIPAGYMWVTADHKIMLSDFNTYNEVGRQVYPIVASLGPITHIQSMSYGPYSLVFFSLDTGNSPTYLVFDTKTNAWYLWMRLVATPAGSLPTNSILSYTLHNGVQRMYSLIAGNTSGTQTNLLQYFDPTSFFDAAIGSNVLSGIPWLVETSWINLMDTASSSVVNEIEVWSDDPSTNVSVYCANSSSDIDNPVLVKTGSLVRGPLRTQKFFLAGSSSFGRYHKVQFFTNSSTGTSATAGVLRQFQFEFFPQTRT